MAKIMLPYVEKSVSKGRVYYRYRRGGRRYPLPSNPATKEFIETYHGIHASFEKEGEPRPAADSIASVIGEFRKSTDFSGLAKTTRKNYLTHLNTISEWYGRYPITAMTRRVVLTFRDSMLTKPEDEPDETGEKPQYPARANYAAEVMRRLLSFAFDRGYIKHNPAVRPGKIKTGTYKPWEPSDIETFRKIAPARMQLALDVALYTGQRLGDILNMTWNQVKDDGIVLTQGKTGAELWVPLHHKLSATLSEHKKTRTSTHIITSAAGKPYKADHFKHEWKKWVDKAGIKGLVFHGLRKTATGCLAEAGCTSEQIKAVTGHKTDRMVAHYVAGANQKQRALAAIHKLETAQPNLGRLPNRLLRDAE